METGFSNFGRTNKDQFGYYTVGDFKTYSKIEAIEVSEQKKKYPTWHFNDTAFSAYNWLIEPTESLAELYAKRARQLREKYDYIVLFYSGGADSGNVLNSFIDNAIPFEEVATYNYWSLDPREDTYFHAEQVKVSYPKIKQLQDQGFRFKHRSIDLSEMSYEILKDPSWNTNRAYYGNGHWGTTHVAKTYIREKIEDYRKIIESGKKLVFVWGIEKPRIQYNLAQKRYEFRFVDIIDNGPGVRNQMLERPWEHDELFYYSPDACDLLCKQGHIIMNFFKKHKNLDPDQIWQDERISNIPDINNMFDNQTSEDGLSGRNLLNWLIYPKFDVKTFSVGKPYSFVYSLRDECWTKDHYFRVQMDMLNEHLKTINRGWLRNPSDPSHGLKFFHSKPYYLD